jgi:glycosyltransferase involved in cell wall biosynthesis
MGIDPIVLTVDPDLATYPLKDTSLLKEVPEGLKLFYTPTREPFGVYQKLFRKKKIPYSGFADEDKEEGLLTRFVRFIRGNLFIPDARKGWNKCLIPEAVRIIKEYNIQNLVTTSPPHSTQLAGLTLKKMIPHLHWIADLRDPWTDIFYYDKMYHLPFVRKVDLNMEKNVLQKADHVTTVSYFLKDLFSKKIQTKIDQKIHVVTNGYDPEDFAFKTQPYSKNKSFTITYTGTLTADYDLGGFAKAIMRMTDQNRDFEMRFVGSISPRWRKEFQLLLKNRLDIIDHVDHRQAIQYMTGADMLLLVIPRIKNNEGIVTGKIFEYIASGNPVLGIGPLEGDASGILNDSGAGKMFRYGDYDSIFQFISDCQNGKVQLKKNNEKIEYWSRAHQLQKWVGLLK